MDEKVTYMQATVHLIVDGTAAAAIELIARAAGIAVNVKQK